jgi:hypothetical protein
MSEQMAGNAQSDGPTAPDLFQRLWEMEDELGLHARQIDGVGYWRLFRFELGRLLSAPEQPNAPPPLDLPARFSRLLQSEIRAASAPAWGPAATIVAPFHRKTRQGGRVVDRFLGDVLAEQRLGPFLVLENLLAADRLAAEPGRQVSFIDKGAALSMARGWAGHRRLLDEARREHGAIDASHRRLFARPYPLSAERMAQRVRHFQERRRDLSARLKRTGAGRLFVAYHEPVLLAAARDAGLQVIEVQHGAVSRYSLQYHHPGRPAVPYFADQLWLFGDYWRAAVELPANCRAVVAGSDLPPKAAKTPRLAVASSHLPNDGRLFETVVRAARAAPHWSFVFRPHPQERFEDYEARLANARPANLRLSPMEENVHTLLAGADVQIGVSSTTLFEGMALGARTIILDLPGAEMMSEVIQAGDAVLAEAGADLTGLLSAAPKARKAEAYFSPRVSPGELLQLAGDR